MRRLAAGFIDAVEVPEIQETKQQTLGEDLGVSLEDPPARPKLIHGGKAEKA
jgi:hypothetical protein